MTMTQDKQRKKAVRERMAETGEPYTEAARHVAGAPAETPAAAVDRFGGHEFEYERDTDLFRCTECGEYEVVADNDDGTFAPCPGLPGWDGDPERVYLLVTEEPEIYNVSWHVSKYARDLGIGRGARFGYRDGRYLVETAPSVVDKLHRGLSQLTAASGGTAANGERKPVACSIERLTFEQGQAVIEANHAAYVAEYGDEDRPYRPAAVVIGAGSPETSALTHCPTCGSPEWLGDGRRGWNPLDVECEVCAGTYDDEPEDDYVPARCIRCGRTFAESDDYHQIAMSGPNSLLFAHSEDC
jgi:hypothetical protein